MNVFWEILYRRLYYTVYEKFYYYFFKNINITFNMFMFIHDYVKFTIEH